MCDLAGWEEKELPYCCRIALEAINPLGFSRQPNKPDKPKPISSTVWCVLRFCFLYERQCKRNSIWLRETKMTDTHQQNIKNKIITSLGSTSREEIILRDTFSLTWSKLTKDIIYAIRWRLCVQLQRRAVALKQQAQKLWRCAISGPSGTWRPTEPPGPGSNE